eukprot:scaffold30021_cov54-Attheya_sp.AAC.1
MHRECGCGRLCHNETTANRANAGMIANAILANPRLTTRLNSTRLCAYHWGPSSTGRILHRFQPPNESMNLTLCMA